MGVLVGCTLLACGGPPPPAGAEELFAELATGVELPEGDWPGIRGDHSTWRILAERERVLRAELGRTADPGTLAELGGVYALAEEFELALPFLVAAIERSGGSGPAAATAWAWLGVRQMGLEDPRAALAFSERALELEPGTDRAHFTLARLALAAGEDDRAQKHLMDAHRFEPANVEAALELASLFEDQGRLEAAGKTLARTLQTDRDHPGLLWSLARVRRSEGAELEAQALEKRHARSIRLDDLGLLGSTADPDDMALVLGRELQRAGELELALEEFAGVVQRARGGPRRIESLAGSLEVLAALGRDGEARDIAAELEELAPDHPALEALD